MNISTQGRSTRLPLLPWRQFVDSLQMPFMVMDPDMVIRYVNAAWCRMVDRQIDQVQGKYVFDAFPESEEVVQSMREVFKTVLSGETVYLDEIQYHIENSDDIMEQFYFRLSNVPVMDELGNVTHIIQQSEDITETREVKRQRDIISAELDHRVKNMLTVLNAIVSLSGTQCETVPDFRKNIAEKLQAISRSHERLARSDWKGLDLKDILTDALSPFCDLDTDNRVEFIGPELKLAFRSTRDASLLFHEFATNAVKYGFLSRPEGRLRVEWIIDPETHLGTLTWTEYGLSGIKKPTQSGFGSLLTSSFPNLEITNTYRPEGLVISIKVDRSILELDQGFEKPA